MLFEVEVNIFLHTFLSYQTKTIIKLVKQKLHVVLSHILWKESVKTSLGADTKGPFLVLTVVRQRCYLLTK